MTGRSRAGERRIGLAEHAVAGDGTITTIGLGSCVAIVLHDAEARVGAMAHVLLPDPSLSRDRANPARFPCTAVPLLVDELRLAGARGPLTAWLVGGASMFRSILATSGLNVGERNVVAARGALERAGIRLVGEDVGGEHGRSVALDVRTGRVSVRSRLAGDREL